MNADQIQETWDNERLAESASRSGSFTGALARVTLRAYDKTTTFEARLRRLSQKFEGHQIRQNRTIARLHGRLSSLEDKVEMIASNHPEIEDEANEIRALRLKAVRDAARRKRIERLAYQVRYGIPPYTVTDQMQEQIARDLDRAIMFGQGQGENLAASGDGASIPLEAPPGFFGTQRNYSTMRAKKVSVSYPAGVVVEYKPDGSVTIKSANGEAIVESGSTWTS